MQVSYTTLLFGSIGYSIPVFGEGNNLLSVVCASAIIWILNFLVLRGVKEAVGLNIITTVAKLVPLAVFMVAIVFVGAFDLDIFLSNFWGDGSMSLLATTVLYALGLIVFVLGRKERQEKVFKGVESIIAIAIVALGVIAAIMIATGKLDVL